MKEWKSLEVPRTIVVGKRWQGWCNQPATINQDKPFSSLLTYFMICIHVFYSKHCLQSKLVWVILDFYNENKQFISPSLWQWRVVIGVISPASQQNSISPLSTLITEERASERSMLMSVSFFLFFWILASEFLIVVNFNLKFEQSKNFSVLRTWFHCLAALWRTIWKALSHQWGIRFYRCRMFSSAQWGQ